MIQSEIKPSKSFKKQTAEAAARSCTLHLFIIIIALKMDLMCATREMSFSRFIQTV